MHHRSQYPPRASSPSDTYRSSEAADGRLQTGDRGTFSLHARRSGDYCTPQPPLAVPGRALPATTWEEVAVSTRPCDKYCFQLRVRYVQIIEFEYECWPRISSRVSIRNIPWKHEYESIPKLMDLEQLPTFISAKRLFFPSMSDPFRHVSHPVCGVVNGSRENSNGRPLASTPRFRKSTPTRTVVVFRSSPNIKWYLAEVKWQYCVRLARSTGFNSAAGRNW